MPTSSFIHLAAAPDVAMLAVACALFGLSVGMGLFLAVSALRNAAPPVVAIIGDAQRRMRREQARQDSNLYRLVLSVLPAFVPVARMLPKSVRESVSERYAAAGWPGGMNDDEVTALGIVIGLILMIPLLLVFLLLKPIVAPLALFGLVIGPGLVSSNLSGRATQRDRSISRTMPFVLDLLTLTMRAGASLLIALQRVAQDFGNLPIGVEFKATLTDIEMGIGTKEAFEKLVLRAPQPVVKQFVDELVQSEELGRPLAETMETLSDRTRIRRIQDAVDTAGRAKVMVMVPSTLVLFATMLLLFAPFIVKFYYEEVTFE